LDHGFRGVGPSRQGGCGGVEKFTSWWPRRRERERETDRQTDRQKKGSKNQPPVNYFL
jgi:hypothetical protein